MFLVLGLLAALLLPRSTVFRWSNLQAVEALGPGSNPSQGTAQWWKQALQDLLANKPASARRHSRVVVLPDIHGDFDQAVAALRLAGVVDDRLQWAGGDALLLQTGDILDRGEHSLLLLELFERLTAQAQAAGGEVVCLLGNHELMNIERDFRYISRKELRWLAAMDLPATYNGQSSSSSDASADTSVSAGAAVGAVSSAEGIAATAAAAAQQQLVQEPLNGSTDTLRSHLQAELERTGGGGSSERHDSYNGISSNVGRSALEESGRGPDMGAAGQQGSSAGLNGHSASSSESSGSSGSRSSAGGHKIDTPSGSPGGGGTAGLHVDADGASSGSGGSARVLLGEGLRVWRSALSPGQPLGAVIRSRPVAYLAQAAGCSLLMVHAGASPVLLRAVEVLVGGRDAPRLAPEQYVQAWNYAVSSVLHDCDGDCLHPSGSTSTSNNDGTSHNQVRSSSAIGGGASGPAGPSGPGAVRGPAGPGLMGLAGLLLGRHGVVWSRRYINNSPTVCAEVGSVVAALGVQAVVVGHTVTQDGRVHSLCGGRLVMGDVGLSREIWGNMAVLECVAGRLTAKYSERDTVQLLPAGAGG